MIRLAKDGIINRVKGPSTSTGYVDGKFFIGLKRLFNIFSIMNPSICFKLHFVYIVELEKGG